MSTFAYCVVHYGVEWFAHSLKSVRDQVDEIYIFYCPYPSFGNHTNLICPDKQEQFKAVSDLYKCQWRVVQPFQSEGYEKAHAVGICARAGADIVLCLDCDEVWDGNYLKKSIQQVKGNPQNIKWRAHFQHYWRSVNWVCFDGAWPERMINLKATHNGEGYLTADHSDDVVHHFGYAQRPEIIRYKIDIWGHKYEVRPNWFNEKFMAWKPGMKDVHPTNNDFWTPVKWGMDLCSISGMIKDHPYYDLEIIE